MNDKLGFMSPRYFKASKLRRRGLGNAPMDSNSSGSTQSHTVTSGVGSNCSSCRVARSQHGKEHQTLIQAKGRWLTLNHTVVATYYAATIRLTKSSWTTVRGAAWAEEAAEATGISSPTSSAVFLATTDLPSRSRRPLSVKGSQTKCILRGLGGEHSIVCHPMVHAPAA